MLNPFKEVNWNPGTAERRKFAVSLIIGFPVLGLLLFLVRGWNHGFPAWFAAGGLAVGLLCWCLPGVARPFYVVWYFLSCCIGIVVGNLMLMLFYYLMFTGVGLLLRAFKRSPISKGFSKASATYWKKAEPVLDSKRYYRQF